MFGEDNLSVNGNVNDNRKPCEPLLNKWVNQPKGGKAGTSLPPEELSLSIFPIMVLQETH